MNVRLKSVFLVSLACLSAAALAYELHNLMVDYMLPILDRRIGFVADFQFFHDGAVRVLRSPDNLYGGNTENGYLLIESGSRIDYGYPPPAVLLFVPLAFLSLPWAFMAFFVINLAGVVLAVFFLRRLVDPEGRQGWLFWLAAGLIVLSTGPSYVTYAFGQVNVIVLYLCLLYLLAIRGDHNLLAGMCLAAGFWLKFYPVFLLSLAPLEKHPIRLLSWSLGWIAMLPLLCSPFLPLPLYIKYFGEIYPALAEQTSAHVYNQSIQAFLMRLSLGDWGLADWGPILTTQSAIWNNNAVMLVLMTVVGWRYYVKRDEFFRAYFSLMAIIPAVVTYGWGGTYMLALPLLVLLLVHGIRGGWMAWFIFSIVWLAFLLPSYRPLLSLLPADGWSAFFYYSRYLFLTLFAVLYINRRAVFFPMATGVP